MNEVTEEVVQELVSVIKGSTDFATEQAPLIAQELIQYSIIQSSVGIVICGALAITLLIMCYQSFILAVEKEEDSYAWVGILTGIMGIVFIFPTIFDSLNLIKLYVAPKLFLLEYLKDFV